MEKLYSQSTTVRRGANGGPENSTDSQRFPSKLEGLEGGQHNGWDSDSPLCHLTSCASLG